MLTLTLLQPAMTSPPRLLQRPIDPTVTRLETFHANTITLTGTLQAVRQSLDPTDPARPPDIVLRLAVYDRFAPLERRGATPWRPAHTITLRLPRGLPLDGRALSLSPRQRVRATGYLRDHRDSLSLQTIWSALNLPDRAQPGDAARLLSTIGTQVVVESLTSLPDPLAPDAYDENALVLDGLAQRVWSPAHSTAARPDLGVRLATYDRYAEELPPAKAKTRRRDPYGQLPTRQAHYTTLRFPGGRTLAGETLSLSPNAVLRVTAHLRSAPYRQSLHDALTRLRQIERLRDGDESRYVQRFAQVIVVHSCICFGSVPFPQL